MFMKTVSNNLIYDKKKLKIIKYFWIWDHVKHFV